MTGRATTGPPVLTCTTCSGLTFTLTVCHCTDGGNRLLVESGDVAGEAYQGCLLCDGLGTVAQGCFDCGRQGVRRAQLVLTVANLDTGAVASVNVVPGSVLPTPDPGGGWRLELTPLLAELTAAAGAGGLVDPPRQPWEEAELVLPLDRAWHPDLPAPQRDAMVAQAIARRYHRPWRVFLGRSYAPPTTSPAQQLERFCELAALLCLDLVVEARRQTRTDITWHVRFEVPGGSVPEEGRGYALDLPAALTTTSVADALTGLGERGRAAPAYSIVPRPGRRSAPLATDLDRLARRVRADLRRAPAAQAIWRDGRWSHTRLLPGGCVDVLHERDTGQVARRRRRPLRRAAEPPAPSWQGPPIGYVTCGDCAPDSRLHQCDCTLGGEPADPGCAHCSGAGFAPSVFDCTTCRGGRRLYRAVTVTLADLRTRARHELWQPCPGEPGAVPVDPTPGPQLHRLAGRYRLAGQASTFGVRPHELIEADGGQPLSVLLVAGLSVVPPHLDPVARFVASAGAGRPGARLIVVADPPDVPSLAVLARLATGLGLTLAVSVRDHRHDLGHDPAIRPDSSWNVELVPPGTPVDRLAPPVRPSVEAALAFCLEYLDNAVTAAVPAVADRPIVVPHAPATAPPVDPVPLILGLAGCFPGDEVIVQLDRDGCRVHLNDADGCRPLASASTLTDAAHALGLPPS
ncbi:hypothetical protein [Micromonospora sp. RTGN7]|uniref:hypothetical protein n=1 Tax=Micromonospora sp. RTGN7 TaxID=3016526 RepID=UPI0029FF3522|nr:hypothetical protein [Micromonospora sp. RTGN7]